MPGKWMWLQCHNFVRIYYEQTEEKKVEESVVCADRSVIVTGEF